MKIRTLVKDLPVTIYGTQEEDITGVEANSKQIAPGNLFLAKRGGAKFISEAIAAGAIAIVTDLYDPFLENVTQVVCKEVEDIELDLLNRFYAYPMEQLFLAGVTGTNGKTTTTYLIKHLLDQEHEDAGLIGTVEWKVGKTTLPSTHTTPDRSTLLHLFHDMGRQGCQSCVMEVSSHALDQGRVDGIPFDVAVFTNLSLDHLDYHKSMEGYAAAKAKLFAPLSTDAYAIYNRDDPWHAAILQGCRAHKISYGFQEGADLTASHLELTPQGMRFALTYQDRCLSFQTALIGRFNVYNLLAAVGCGLARHLPLEAIVEDLSTFQCVPGRLERVANARGLNVFVDYAHTDDALKNVLETLHELKRGRIITVFGCGGNRDTTKRPKMARAAATFSDHVIVTSDNPRQEDPEVIIQQIITGFSPHDQFSIEKDRKRAIHKALDLATPSDIVLIAGKGHETTQILSHQTLPFDDRQVVREKGLS